MKKIMTMIGLMLIAGYVSAESMRIYQQEDTAPIMRVLNSSDSNAIVSFDGVGVTGVLSVTVNGYETEYAWPSISYDTAGELASAVSGSSNTECELWLTVDGNCSISSDSVSNTIIAGSYTIRPGEWKNVGKWDTSLAKFFDCYVPGGDVGGAANAKTINKVFGYAAGTGDVTLDMYANGTQFFEDVTVSPVYVITSVGTTNTTADNVSPGKIDRTFSIPIGGKESILIRATRSTTATDYGGIGAVIDLR